MSSQRVLSGRSTRVAPCFPMVLAAFALLFLLPGTGYAWSWHLGDSPEKILSIFKKGDPGLVPRKGSSTELPCGIYTDYDAHPTDRFIFYSPTTLKNGRMTPEFQFEFRQKVLQAVLVTAPFTGVRSDPTWRLRDILPDSLQSVAPRVIHARLLSDAKGINLPRDAVLIWDYKGNDGMTRELQVLVYNADLSPDYLPDAPVAAYLRAYKDVLLDEGKTIPLPMSNPFMKE
ncbi:MAG: hypothetical protein VST70_08395 [Nitrospirota bacterium]|nr:hypothetical protein [Nitrospirota bacterium]